MSALLTYCSSDLGMHAVHFKIVAMCYVGSTGAISIVLKDMQCLRMNGSS